MKLKLIGLAVASALTLSAQASDYQTELSLGYLGNGDGNAVLLGGQYNFDVVDTSNIALSEAAFYERSNNVFVQIGTGDLDAQIIGLEYYFNDQFYVAPSYTNVEIFGENEGFLALGLGYSPFKGLLISTTVPENNYDLNLNAKYVAPLAGDAAFNLEASFIDSDFDNDLSIAGDYYFNKYSGVGLAIGDDTFTISGEHFFTDMIKVGISYTDNSGADGVVGLDVAWRF